MFSNQCKEKKKDLKLENDKKKILNLKMILHLPALKMNTMNCMVKKNVMI